ncbi:MAG TPA: hypothetical protein VFE61_09300 [Candidatus Sulfotelmatobacter sp.]|nr:hypothetical protein [Candidatus Sulfotelmatobacter sp.]
MDSGIARLWKAGIILLFLAAALPLPARAARDKDATQYGAGLILNVPFPENEVAQVVQDVAQNGIIRGTKEYNNDEFVKGAEAATSTRVFPAWNEGGKVFYKIRLKALDPRNFKDTNDLGTLAVRYVVQPQGDKNTVLRIDAVFVEDFRHTVHQSNGSVETAEYKDIHDRLDAITLMKSEAAEAEKEKQERREQPTNAQSSPELPSSALESSASKPTPVPQRVIVSPATEAPETETAPPAPVQTPEEHLKELKQQVERLVKAPGAPLKSAPFHTASTLQTLTPGTEVLIVISTPYWFGVETHAGQHGWILRDQLELLP